MSYDEVNFRGKYAKYIKELTSETKIHPKLFGSYYEAFIFCAVYGVLNGRMEDFNPSTDHIEGEQPATIRSEVITNSSGAKSYALIRKIIILSETGSGKNFEERIDNALRFDLPIEPDSRDYLKEKSMYDQNTEMIYRYALGGLSMLYEKITSVSSRSEMIDMMCDIKEDFLAAINYKE